MKTSDIMETLLVRALLAGVRATGWKRSLPVGAALGDLVRVLGIRRRVAESNLALAFPERDAEQRAVLLRDHYRELGRVLAEYARLGELVHAAPGEVIAEVRGLQHLEAARAAGRGAILLSGHFGNVELLGAWLGRMHLVDLVVRPLHNPGVEALLARERARAGVGMIATGAGVRRVREALRANHWVPMLADQDARRHGVFVPFFGRPTSTPLGPARLALRSGAPLIMGFATRRPDGRHELDIDPPLQVSDPDSVDAAERLTALHTARLEHWVRRRPEAWFWIHRRWKTAPPAAVNDAGGERDRARAVAC